MADPARCFVAVHLGPAARQAVADAIARLRGHGAAVRWVDPARAHLTLKFLGDVPRADLPELQEVLRVVPTDGPLHLGLEGGGRFPPRGPARVAWAGLAGDVGRLGVLQERIESMLGELGFAAEERGFRPHLTLGRIKQARGSEGMIAALERLGLHTEPEAVAEFVLYESELTPAGAVHTAIERYPL